jgi:hypothetical protein
MMADLKTFLKKFISKNLIKIKEKILKKNLKKIRSHMNTGKFNFLINKRLIDDMVAQALKSEGYLLFILRRFCLGLQEL